nr:MAG TPA: hypothetical protein [Caudoviricetes sp.]
MVYPSIPNGLKWLIDEIQAIIEYSTLYPISGVESSSVCSLLS